MVSSPLLSGTFCSLCETVLSHTGLLDGPLLTPLKQWDLLYNKANVRDLIAVTGLVILLKLGSNHWFFIPYDLEFRWPTLKNNRVSLLGYIKLCALFPSHHTGVTVRKRSIQVKISRFLSCVTLKIWRMTLKVNRAPLLCYFKLCASFPCHWSIQTGVKGQKHHIWVKISIFCPVWPWNLMDDQAPLLCYIKLCVSLHHHMWIRTGVTVRKWQNWVLTSVTFTFDLWP